MTGAMLLGEWHAVAAFSGRLRQGQVILYPRLESLPLSQVASSSMSVTVCPPGMWSFRLIPQRHEGSNGISSFAGANDFVRPPIL